MHQWVVLICVSVGGTSLCSVYMYSGLCTTYISVHTWVDLRRYAVCISTFCCIVRFVWFIH